MALRQPGACAAHDSRSARRATKKGAESSRVGKGPRSTSGYVLSRGEAVLAATDLSRIEFQTRSARSRKIESRSDCLGVRGAWSRLPATCRRPVADLSRIEFGTSRRVPWTSCPDRTVLALEERSRLPREDAASSPRRISPESSSRPVARSEDIVGRSDRHRAQGAEPPSPQRVAAPAATDLSRIKSWADGRARRESSSDRTRVALDDRCRSRTSTRSLRQGGSLANPVRVQSECPRSDARATRVPSGSGACAIDREPGGCRGCPSGSHGQLGLLVRQASSHARSARDRSRSEVPAPSNSAFASSRLRSCNSRTLSSIVPRAISR